MKLHLDMHSDSRILREHGVSKGGYVQKYIDQECIRHMSKYTPFKTGILEKSATMGTVLGDGEINQDTPYARFQYYGKLMIDPMTGSPYAGYGVSKELTEKDLEYSKANHPLAGSYWFERMKADKKDTILRGAQTLLNRGYS